MKKFFFPLICAVLFLGLSACKGNPEEPIVPDPEEPTLSYKDIRLSQIDSIGWCWQKDWPTEFAEPLATVSTDPIRLHFFGWNLEEDSLIHLTFPDSTEQYGRVWLTYRMGGWNEGPAEWDMTTMIKIYDKENDQWLELVRAITPYGGSFGDAWEKFFYIDVTEFLPLLKGDVDLRIFYCGWDATDTRAHTAKLTFSFYGGPNPYGEPMGWQKIYDSTLPNPGGNGYRAWSYGVQGWSIEDESRLGNRTIDVPAGATTVLLRVCITGHGQDAYNGKGYFPNRSNTRSNSCAEFDKNHYTISLNGEPMKPQGYIWELNGSTHNYSQAGTYHYNRGGWGPGKPCNVQHWIIGKIPAEGEKITINFDLEEYISPCTKPNDDKVACYYVMTDAFFFR